jgi:hypothetical protein
MTRVLNTLVETTYGVRNLLVNDAASAGQRQRLTFQTTSKGAVISSSPNSLHSGYSLLTVFPLTTHLHINRNAKIEAKERCAKLGITLTWSDDMVTLSYGGCAGCSDGELTNANVRRSFLGRKLVVFSNSG